ncbi:restriction endonuclease [Flavobacterium sp. NG2]|uniref:restriction endonuclease n=1 Tax=Flavobacterium sp. NG2 TaxID=3097547 RepID=UPI002A83D996|nr:ATP cone domain-containing protein [Flavobacterium sp. NG2]WPR72738.1 restriction endonuclease [Flavobacterium sp. NG2]
MKVIKQSGERVNFEPEKLRSSLFKSGASVAVVDLILQKVSDEVYDGISTKNIYKKAFGLLKKGANSFAARYNVKTAIQMLGPAGFHFEKYIARLFESEKFETKINMTLQGKCVSHEVDILVKKNDRIEMVECKFHGSQAAVSDVKIPMYILSRYNDLNVKEHEIFSHKDVISSCLIVTNNRFTTDAIDFANCSGINLLSWDYPENNNLETKNLRDCLYPVTCLTTLASAEKDKLLNAGVILARELLEEPEVLNELNISSKRKINVLREVEELCKCF